MNQEVVIEISETEFNKNKFKEDWFYATNQRIN